MPRSFALVHVETDAGHVGYGEASTSYGHMHPWLVECTVDRLLNRVLIGADTLDTQARKLDVTRYLSPWIGWECISSQVIGAVETVLWDILGKGGGQASMRGFDGEEAERLWLASGRICTGRRGLGL